MINHEYVNWFILWMIFIPAISLFIWGLYAVTRQGMALAAARNMLASLLPEWAMSPLLDCPICMPSFWTATLGTWYGACVLNMQAVPLFAALPFVALAIAGTNSLISDIREYVLREPQCPIE